ASIALAEGRDAWPILMGIGPAPAGRAGAAPTTPTDPLLGHGHLAYALSRFSDDPHLKLVRIVAVEASPPPAPGAVATGARRPGMVEDQLAAQMCANGADVSPGAQKPLALAVAAAEELTADPIVGPEARLRGGYLQLRLGRRDLALQHFRRIDTKDTFVA